MIFRLKVILMCWLNLNRNTYRGLIRLEMMRLELESLWAHPVDLLTPKSLHPSIRQAVQDQAQVVYAAA